MTRLTLCLLLVALAGCATGRSPDGQLHAAYRAYLDATASGTLASRKEDFLSAAMLSRLDFAQPESANELALTRLRQERNHYEKQEAQRGCLTVNGDSLRGEPVALFLAYQPSGNRWLINDYHLIFTDTPAAYDTALCPDEARVEMLRRFEAATPPR